MNHSSVIALLAIQKHLNPVPLVWQSAQEPLLPSGVTEVSGRSSEALCERFVCHLEGQVDSLAFHFRACAAFFVPTGDCPLCGAGIKQAMMPLA